MFVKMQLDRFIPNRSAMDFDYAHYMLSGGKVKKEHYGVNSPSKEAYSKQLAEIFNMNRTRILAFKNKPPHSAERVSESPSSIQQQKTVKKRRYIPQVSFLSSPFYYHFFFFASAHANHTYCISVHKCFILGFVPNLENSFLVNSLRRGPWMLLTS